jgi:hypothetical protein
MLKRKNCIKIKDKMRKCIKRDKFNTKVYYTSEDIIYRLRETQTRRIDKHRGIDKQTDRRVT